MIVVTGATGNVGRPLVHALAAAGQEVVSVSRGAAPADLPAGVLHRQADLTQPGAVPDGADTLVLIVPGAGVGVDPHEFAKVRRVVVLSSQAAGTRPESVSHAPLRALEDVIREAGGEWTMLRPGGFASNAFAWVESVRSRRTVVAPFGGVGLPVVDPADIAEVAAAVLLHDGHAGKVYELTGPALSTPRQRAAAIGDAIGADITFVEQSRAEAYAQMTAFMPGPVADGTLDIIGSPTPAEQRISPDVQAILGRPARGFDEWAQRHAALFG
ncbi:SDR family oxidoreductase [Actinoplanes sp. NPDC051494]|uniref:SDR family oxidoreductase n=1 Tax=Actinoplanes sp. NPDC051494 TaxID=3363907 RepID=UPI00379EEEAE